MAKKVLGGVLSEHTDRVRLSVQLDLTGRGWSFWFCIGVVCLPVQASPMKLMGTTFDSAKTPDLTGWWLSCTMVLVSFATTALSVGHGVAVLNRATTFAA